MERQTKSIFVCFAALLAPWFLTLLPEEKESPAPVVFQPSVPLGSVCGESFRFNHGGSGAYEISLALLEASADHGVELELLTAVMAAESGCRIDARSRAGALGLMQLMPATARWLGVKEPFSVRDNVFGGAKYLAVLLEQFKGNEHLALAAYNAGPTTVRRYKSIPPYPETRAYVKRVIALRDALRSSDELRAV